MNETYEELLARAPQDHFSEEFKLFLINNNEVRHYNGRWLVIENCKYWTPGNDWITAFYMLRDSKVNARQGTASFQNSRNYRGFNKTLACEVMKVAVYWVNEKHLHESQNGTEQPNSSTGGRRDVLWGSSQEVRCSEEPDTPYLQKSQKA